MKKDFNQLLENKKFAPVILDPKWHEIFRYLNKTPEIQKLEDELGDLLKIQGKSNTESKDIKKIKAKLMEEVVSISGEINAGNSNPKLEKEINDKKRLINECNEKLSEYQDNMLDIPEKIDEINKKIMLCTLELCYVNIKKNTDELKSIDEWINAARVQLKKQVLRKQDRETKNKDMYSYLHSIFGADVLDAFDLGVAPGLETKKEATTG